MHDRRLFGANDPHHLRNALEQRQRVQASAPAFQRHQLVALADDHLGMPMHACGDHDLEAARKGGLRHGSKMGHERPVLGHEVQYLRHRRPPVQPVHVSIGTLRRDGQAQLQMRSRRWIDRRPSFFWICAWRRAAHQHAVGTDRINEERLGELDTAEAGARQTNVEFPVFSSVTHGLVVAAHGLPGRPADQHAIGQLIEEQLIEPIEVAREHAGERAGKAPVGENETRVGRRVFQERHGLGEVGGLQHVVAVERQDEFRSGFEKAPVARTRQVAVLLMHNPHSRTEMLEFFAGRHLGRAIVDNDGLEVAKSLGAKTRQ